MDQPGNNSQYFGADNSYIDFTTFPFTLKRERKEVCTKKKKKKRHLIETEKTSPLPWRGRFTCQPPKKCFEDVLI